MTEKQWNRLFREILQSPALELDKALSNLISLADFAWSRRMGKRPSEVFSNMDCPSIEIFWDLEMLESV